MPLRATLTTRYTTPSKVNAAQRTLLARATSRLTRHDNPQTMRSVAKEASMGRRPHIYGRQKKSLFTVRLQIALFFYERPLVPLAAPVRLILTPPCPATRSHGSHTTQVLLTACPRSLEPRPARPGARLGQVADWQAAASSPQTRAYFCAAVF